MKSTLPHHYLKPGEMYFAVKPAIVSTVLGSCVSVTMFHPQRRIGAICHGLLPICRESENCRSVEECEDGFRNMKCSLRAMFEKFRNMGIAPRELEVKVFGGAEMFHVGEVSTTKPGVGNQNAAMTLRLMEEAGVAIMASDLGGKSGRKIYFNTYTGEVLLKRMRKNSLIQGHYE